MVELNHHFPRALCTGPFSQYGSKLVKACAGKITSPRKSFDFPIPLTVVLNSLLIENGTHYCDITGETDWVRQMIDLYDDAARKTGAKIISFCGHDCIPWDLCGKSRFSTRVITKLALP